MKDFLYLFKNTAPVHSKLSPEEMQKHMQEWGAWMEGFAKAGRLKGGDPLEESGKTVTGKKKIVTDGPFPESKELVGGYLIIQAENLAEAVEMSKGCPGLSIESCNVEVRPIKKMEF